MALHMELVVTQEGAFALLKPGTISISESTWRHCCQCRGSQTIRFISVRHTDIFARPNQDSEIQTTISNVTDDAPIAAITDLTVPGT
jgi:hypothetical protein